MHYMYLSCGRGRPTSNSMALLPPIGTLQDGIDSEDSRWSCSPSVEHRFSDICDAQFDLNTYTYLKQIQLGENIWQGSQCSGQTFPTWLPCYLVTLLHCYQVLFTFLPFYIVTLLPCYRVTLLPCYLATLLPCYIVSWLHCYVVTSLRSYLVTSLRCYLV